MDLNRGKMDLREHGSECASASSRIKASVDGPYHHRHGVPIAQGVTAIPPAVKEKDVKKVALTLETWKGRIQAENVRTRLR